MGPHVTLPYQVLQLTFGVEHTNEQTDRRRVDKEDRDKVVLRSLLHPSRLTPTMTCYLKRPDASHSPPSDTPGMDL